MKAIPLLLCLILAAGLTGCGEETSNTGSSTSTGGSSSSGGGPTQVDASKFLTTSSGLQYATIKSGSGTEAKPGDRVQVHYTGWLKENGEKFDSSLDRGQPFDFVLGAHQVIPGWDEGVARMKIGEKRQLVVPPKLGYGETGTPGGPIPPNATLVFDVELLQATATNSPPGTNAPPPAERVTPIGGSAPSKPAKVPPGKFKSTLTGLKYAILQSGKGKVAQAGDLVAVHYTGWVKKDGTKFDSSLDRGQPITFTLGNGQVIPGWDEGVAGMKVGEKRQLVIPAKLAYGEGGKGPIPPNADLIFDVELVNVG